MDRIIKLIDEILEIRNVDLDSLEFNDLQSFDSLRENFELNITQLIGGTYNTLIIDSDKHIRFFTIIPPGLYNSNKYKEKENKGFPIHFHDCLEDCTVLKGQLDDILLQTSFKKGEKCTYKPFVKHLPANLSQVEELHIQVDFYKI